MGLAAMIAHYDHEREAESKLMKAAGESLFGEHRKAIEAMTDADYRAFKQLRIERMESN